MKTLVAILMIGLGSGSEDFCTEGTCTKQAPSLVTTKTMTATAADEQQKQQQDDNAVPKWNIHDDNHPCNIEILSADDFERMFPDGFPTYYSKPIILRMPLTNRQMRDETSEERIASFFADDGIVMLPKANLYTLSTDNITIQDYIHLPETMALDRADQKLYMLTSSVKDFGSYALPPLHGGVRVVDKRLGIGPLGSGAQWHNHGPGFCEALQGRKLWVLWDGEERPAYDRHYVSRHWFEYLYAEFVETKTTKERRLWECTIHPGDAIYFPNNFWHSTLNLDPYTVFVSTFFDLKVHDVPQNEEVQ